MMLLLDDARTADSETRARVLAVVVGLVFLIPGPIYVLVGYDGGGGAQAGPEIVLPIAFGIAAIHVRHAVAAVRGDRPRWWPVTFLALLALVYAPMDAWSWNWASMQTFVIASSLMLLRTPLSVVAAAIPVAATAAVAWHVVHPFDADAGPWMGMYWVTGLAVGGVSLYASTRVIRLLDELARARADLAESAVGRERLRVSRDLHDLLGQSLSAVSLKGDLALALLRRDPVGARSEIEGLTAVARSALHDIRAVTRDEHAVSFAAEVDGARTLLAAAGVRTTVDLDGAAGDLHAWAVREGTTNVLRHSEAGHCGIRLHRADGLVTLEIENDGVRGPRAEGSGLASLAERAGALGGFAVASVDGDRFRLVVSVPESTVEVHP